MKPRLSITISIILFLLVGFTLPSVSHAKNYEIMGQEAEDKGKLRKALKYYMSALESSSEQSSRGLREKIIKLVQEIEPPPALPKKAKKHMARGRAAVKAAELDNDEKDFLKAAKEFRKAIKAAPWFAEGYFSLGYVLDNGGKYDEAIRNLNLYLISSPEDASEVEDLIYEIEYRQEESLLAKAEDQQREAEQTQNAKHQERRLTKSEELEQHHLSMINGHWKKATGLPHICQFRVIGNDIERRYIWQVTGIGKGIKVQDGDWHEVAEGISFDGEKFTAKLINGGRTPDLKNWSLTVVNDNLMMTYYYDSRAPLELRDQKMVWRRER